MSSKDQSLFKPTTLDEVVGIAGYADPRALKRLHPHLKF